MLATFALERTAAGFLVGFAYPRAARLLCWALRHRLIESFHVAACDRRCGSGGYRHRPTARRARRLVRVVTRRGTGPERAAIERIAADATDAARLSALAAGAVALYNCANPLYHRWLTDWPPLASALLAAAERTGAVLATVSNLYGYGPVDAPITPATPLAATHPKLRLRAEMWRDALAAHQAGRIRATEVRGSDYVEANSIFSFALAAPLSAGKRAYAGGSRRTS